MEENNSCKDINGNPIYEGAQVLLMNAPEELLKGLPIEDQTDIRAQVERALTVQGVDAHGNIELEFQSDDEIIHTIWVNSKHLKIKVMDSNSNS